MKFAPCHFSSSPRRAVAEHLRAAGAVFLALFGVLGSGCQTGGHSKKMAHKRMQMEELIAKERRGPTFIGRRYYKIDYKMWGYIRRPTEKWSQAQLVMLNENKALAPDRALNAIGMDNGYEYQLWGKFSGEKVYEPASNRFYPEFVLERAELRDDRPGPIFKDSKTLRHALDPEERYFPAPY
jgi:hypothetical protein